ncbi:MAG TPA: penicillin acylase family protein [Desulfobacterales bacterium]
MTRRFRKWVGIAVLALFGLAGLAGGVTYLWYRYTVARSQPVIEGNIEISELRQKVEILRDDFGIPHIYAENPRDLYLAMGYAMAQDRLWQMEFYRRLGSGRLSELFGHKMLEVDRLFRTLALAQHDVTLPEETSFIPGAFAAGINAYIRQSRDRLPLEFTVLGHQPELWSAQDYLSVLRVVQWGLSLGWKVDRTAARILAAVGQRRFGEAFPPPSDNTPVIQTNNVDAWNDLPVSLDEVAARQMPITGWRPSPASNNWVVSGDRSLSGYPILANDTHMALSNPSIWWEVHLVCQPEIDAAGFAIPGLPGLPIGHNSGVAWGVTNVMLDDVDFYVEKIHPEDRRRYRYEGRWLPMRVIDTTLQIRGGGSEPLQVQLTRNGPVLRRYERDGEPYAIAVRWSALELNPPAAAGYRLLQANSTAEVIAALSGWDTPGQNFVFADTAGNIGYWCAAAIPIRGAASGLLPLDGWKPENAWQGFVPFMQRPHRINPAVGYIATANNPVAGTDYGHALGNYWESADRILRICDRLGTTAGHSKASMRAIQSDVYNPLAAELVAVVISALPGPLPEKWQQAALDILKRWDCRMTVDSAGALIFEAVYLQLLERIFRASMGPELYRAYLDTVVFPPRALRRIIQSGASAWLPADRTDGPDPLLAAAAAGFKQAAADLRNRFGDDPAMWRWGAAHTLTFTHVLAAKKPLGALFNLGPFPSAGTGLTVNKKSYDYNRPFEVREGVSQRMIVDLSDPLNARHVLPTGESGLLGNDHYRDQLPLYLKAADRVMPMQRTAVEARSEGRLQLLPATQP